MKIIVLLAVIATLLVAVGLYSRQRPALSPSIQPTDSRTIQVEHFRYTELQKGVPIYYLLGEQMHDESARFGDLRVAVMRVIHIKGVQLELLQPNVAGWLFMADHGQLLAGNRQLSLWGNVHGHRRQGGTLRAGRLLVDPRSGVVTLRGGYVLDVGNQHERGVAIELSP